MDDSIRVIVDGKTYSAKLRPGKGYRLNIEIEGKRRDIYLKNAQEAQSRVDEKRKSLRKANAPANPARTTTTPAKTARSANKPKPSQPKGRPKSIKVRYLDKTYTATRQADGQYRARVDAGIKPIYCGTDPKLAQEVFQEKAHAYFNPELAPKDQRCATLDEAIDDFLEVKKATLAHMSYYTLERKFFTFKPLVPGFLHTPLDMVTERQWLKLRHKLTEKHSKSGLNDLFRKALWPVLKRVEKTHSILLPWRDALKAWPAPAVKLERRKLGKKKHFEPEEIRLLYNAASPMWKLMILMGINGAMEPGDLAKLRWQDQNSREDGPALDLKSGWFDSFRAKTAAHRRFQLWPETVATLKEHRRGQKPKSAFVFTTQAGKEWKDTNRSMSMEFRKLMEKAGVHVTGRGFYGLRHSFKTIADKCRGKEKFALDLVMGHTPRADDMGAVYRGEVDDPHIELVCEFVRLWVFDREESARQYNKEWLVGDVQPRLRVISEAEAAA